jgi:4-carboxymuconolactone decarboxylase
VARLDPLPMEALTPEQRQLHAELGRTRKRVSGPFAIWLRNPPLADAANRVALAPRDNGKLARRLYQLIALTVVRLGPRFRGDERMKDRPKRITL